MERTTYEVVPVGHEWALREQGSETNQLFATRDEAIAQGRETCQANPPSRLRMRKVGAAPEGV